MRDGPRARHVMGDGDGRDPEIAYKADDQAVDRMGTDRVQPGRRLVEEQDFRMARDGAGERDPLLHAARKFRRAQVQHLRAEPDLFRSEEHTSELQSLMRNSYAVFCLKKKNIKQTNATD